MEVGLSSENDVIGWVFEKDAQFSTSPLYKFGRFGGVICERMREIWTTKVPMKVKIFLWTNVSLQVAAS
jgi:hypothetical protein